MSAVMISVNGQIPNTLFFMPGVPQSNRINPAIQPGSGFYFGFPMLAPLRLQVSSSSLAFDDVIFYNAEAGSLITALHPNADKELFLDNFKDVNYFLTSLGTSIGSLGFKAGESFFSFDITTRVDGNIYYPKGLFELFIEGPADSSVISFSGIGADVNVFNEFSMGWSKKDFIIPNLDIGVRGKALFGLVNLTTKQSDFELATSREEWSIHSNFQLNVAAPEFVTFNDDFENMNPVEMDFSIFENLDPKAIISNIFSLNRFGLAIDAGVNYRPVPQVQLSASILDLGSIKWRNTMQGAFEFDYIFSKGIEASPFTGIDTTFIGELADSVMNAVSFLAGQPYTSGLYPKLFVGASFYPVKKIGFGILSRTDFLNQTISQQFTGSVNMTTGKFINLSLSYSYMSHSFNNIGAGLSLNLGTLNMYILSDNIVSAALSPLSTRSVSLWFGLNQTFGWNRAKKKEKAIDRPLI